MLDLQDPISLAVLSVGAALYILILVRVWQREEELHAKIGWSAFALFFPILGPIMYYFYQKHREQK